MQNEIIEPLVKKLLRRKNFGKNSRKQQQQSIRPNVGPCVQRLCTCGVSPDIRRQSAGTTYQTFCSNKEDAQGHCGGAVPGAELSMETLGFSNSPVKSFPLFLLTLRMLFNFLEV